MSSNSNTGTNYIDAESAAEILQCSYPTIIGLIKKNKLKAKKQGKCWLIDAAEVQKAKESRLVTPRPRKNKEGSMKASSSIDSLGQDEIELRLKIPKNKYQLINLALESKEKKNLKQYLESTIDSLYQKIQKHIEDVSF